jgi:protein-S-isoprenylcysteine O-methyltransferase Ste14
MLGMKLALGTLAQTVLFGALLFLPAGTVHWWRGWVLLFALLAASAASVASLYPHHKGVLEERMKAPFQKGQPRADKVLSALMVVTLLSAVAMAPLDVFHLHLFRQVPALLSALGLLAIGAGFVLMTLALKYNAFASAVIRHQTERGHAVAASGPYAFVRHPMYTGAFFYMLGLPLWLGSYAGVLFITLPFALLVVRIFLEEKFLRRALPGYQAYTQAVSYRLVPRVW